ncbi:MAG: hypothetical protein ACRD51_00855 [Candidatus Acidiferrum sp.]
MARSRREVNMSPIREQVLTLLEVEAVIHKFEEKYQMSTTEFLTNSEFRCTLLDDEVFQWEAFNAHRDELERAAEEVRSDYLKRLKRSPEDSRSANNNLALAA